MIPQARRDGLIVEQLDGETVIYDERTQQAHYLNRVAAEVWQRADGTTEVESLAAEIEQALGVPCHADAVQLALEQLSQRGLLTETLPTASRETKMGRRETLKRMACALALPFVITILAKTAVAQASEPGDDGGFDGGDGGFDGGLDGGFDGGGFDGGGFDGGSADGGSLDSGAADGGAADSGDGDGAADSGIFGRI